MFFKKTIILGTILAVNLPIAHAEGLDTYNHTPKFSTVVIAGVICAGSRGKFTAPGGYLHATTTEVRTMCLGANPCTATIVVADNENDIKTCKGTTVAVGTAVVTTNNPGANPILITGLHPTSIYKFTGKDTNRLDINS